MLSLIIMILICSSLFRPLYRRGWGSYWMWHRPMGGFFGPRMYGFFGPGMHDFFGPGMGHRPMGGPGMHHPMGGPGMGHGGMGGPRRF